MKSYCLCWLKENHIFASDEEGLSSDVGNNELKLAVDDAIKKRKLARLTFERNLESAGLQLEYEYKSVSRLTYSSSNIDYFQIPIYLYITSCLFYFRRHLMEKRISRKYMHLTTWFFEMQKLWNWSLQLRSFM